MGTEAYDVSLSNHLLFQMNIFSKHFKVEILMKF